MNVLLDGRTAATGLHGIARATAELAAALPAHLPAAWQMYVLRLSEDGDPAAGNAVIPCRARPYSFQEQLEIPRVLARGKVDLYHLPTFWGPLRVRAPLIVTIHDLIHPLFYGRRKPHYLFLYRVAVARLVRKARRIVTGSEASAALVRAYFQLPAERVCVIPYGGDHIGRFPSRKPEGLELDPGGFCYAMGNERPHKNLVGAVQAYRLYRGLVHEPVPLVVVGGAGELADPGQQIHVVRDLSDGELRWLRENAAYGLFPSFMEGFDLPLLEALGSGGAAVASDIRPHREIVGEDYPLVAPDPEAMAQLMVRMERERGLREELSRTGREQAARFTWSETARRVVGLWRQLLEDADPGDASATSAGGSAPDGKN